MIILESSLLRAVPYTNPVTTPPDQHPTLSKSRNPLQPLLPIERLFVFVEHWKNKILLQIRLQSKVHRIIHNPTTAYSLRIESPLIIETAMQL